MKDYYNTLGVERTATADDIKRAYRKLASQHHPDKGGDVTKFQEIEEAYRTLSDAQKRQEYDNPGFNVNFGGMGGSPFDSIFDMFGSQFGNQQRTASMRISLGISLKDVATVGKRVLSLNSRQGMSNAEIDLPYGIEDGTTVRYRGAAPGNMDLIVQFRVHPDAKWQRNGFNLITDHTVDMWDLILGSEATIVTLTDNQIILKIPENTEPGTILRVRGHGLPSNPSTSPGDLLVRIQARLPDNIPASIRDQIKQIKKT